MLLCCTFSSYSLASEADGERGNGESKRLVIASSNNFPPINMLDEKGRLTGFASDLADAVADEMGYEVTHIHSAIWPEVLAWLDEGHADLIHDTGYNPERERYLDFTLPIIEMPESIFVRDQQFDINNLDSLGDKRVACVNQHITHLYLQKHTEIDCYLVNTPAEGLIALINGNADAFIYPEQIVLYLAQQHKLDHKIKVVGEPLRTLSWSMTVKDGNDELLQVLNRGIEAVKESGEYQIIYDKWFGRGFFAGYSEKEVVVVVGGAVVLTLLIAITIGLLFYARGIKRANEALSESEGKYRTLADKVPASIFLKDKDSAYISCNQRYADSLGIRPDEIAGKSDYDFHPANAEEYRAGDKKVIESGETDEFIEVYVEKGKEICVNTIKTPVYDKNGILLGVLGIFWDITEKRQLQEQLVQSQKMEAIGQLTGGIAHDFNNMLASILGFSDLSLQRLKMDGNVEKISEYLAEVVKSGNRARDLVRQMLAFARTNRGDLQEVNIDELYAEVVTMLKPMLTARVELVTDIQDKHITVQADRVMLEQVLINLCINARDAMTSHGVVELGAHEVDIDGGICASCHQPFSGNYIELTVSDTGEGIREELMMKIFDPFVTTKEVGKGSGMGLSMVHGIVHEHYGHMIVDSVPGNTSFRILLPRS